MGLRLESVVDQAHLLTQRVNASISWLGLAAGNALRMLERMWEAIGQIVARIEEMHLQVGVPWTLWSHGKQWSGPPVAGRISALVALPTLDAVRADDYWQGRAADAYRNTLPRQKEALAQLVRTAQR